MPLASSTSAAVTSGGMATRVPPKSKRTVKTLLALDPLAAGCMAARSRWRAAMFANVARWFRDDWTWWSSRRVFCRSFLHTCSSTAICEFTGRFCDLVLSTVGGFGGELPEAKDSQGTNGVVLRMVVSAFSGDLVSGGLADTSATSMSASSGHVQRRFRRVAFWSRTPSSSATVHRSADAQMPGAPLSEGSPHTQPVGGPRSGGLRNESGSSVWSWASAPAWRPPGQ